MCRRKLILRKRPNKRIHTGESARAGSLPVVKVADGLFRQSRADAQLTGGSGRWADSFSAHGGNAVEKMDWTVESWRRRAQEQLTESGDLDADWDADWMLCEALGCGRGELRWKKNEKLSDEAARKLNGWLRERTEGRPLQYVLGNTCFMGLDFKCDERALIPRQDTETLVETALHRMQHKKNPRVLDLCTGTGAIGLSIGHYRTDAQVTLTDISEDAIALAKENAAALGVSVRLVRGDLLEAVFGEKFDFVLSNPPYLTEKDMDGLMREVRHEPEIALRAGEDGLSFYRRIAEGLRDVLNEGGEALLEIGKGQEEDVMRLLNERGFCAEAHKDLCGVDRVIRAWRD